MFSWFDWYNMIDLILNFLNKILLLIYDLAWFDLIWYDIIFDLIWFDHDFDIDKMYGHDTYVKR